MSGTPVDLHIFREVLTGVLQLVLIQNDIKHLLMGRQGGGEDDMQGMELEDII